MPDEIATLHKLRDKIKRYQNQILKNYTNQCWMLYP